MCDEGDLELGKYPVPQIIVANCLKRMIRNLITYNNSFPIIKRTLPLQRQIKYVEDEIFTRDTENLGMSMKEVIQIISDIGQENSYVQADNHLDYLIQEKRLKNMKRHGRVIKYHETTMERSYICVSQQ